MALLSCENFEKLEKEHCSVHEPIGSTFSIFTKEKHKYIQINMYGSKNRKHSGKISQTIQIDREMARVLISLLKEEFDI